MRRIIKTVFAVLIVGILLVSCDNAISGDYEEAKEITFTLSNTSTSKSASLSTGDGDNTILFSTLTGHKIKLECTDGTGFCSLSGATSGFVAWPTTTVQLGYGTWNVKAEGYKGTTKYYENSAGVTFIVGPKGVSTDNGETWGSSVSITESYCNTESAKIKANSSLTIKNESEITITLGSGNYSGYQLKWYKTTTETPTNLTTARTILELTAVGTDFTEWTNPTTAINVGSNTYVLVAIVASTNPSTIFGSVAVKLENLSAGMTYTIGSGNSDYVQFGKYGVEFEEPTESYHVRGLGPAGGYIFYDCDADNDFGNADGLISSECGWRYLEAAPENVFVDDPSDWDKGLRTLNSSHDTVGIVFGTKFDSQKRSLYVNNSLTYNENDCTKTSIGSGKTNTDLIVDFFGDTVRWDYSYETMATHYAAKECKNYSYGGCDDWFLPSKDELSLMYTNLKLNDLGDFNTEDCALYWSSSESTRYSDASAWYISFDSGSANDNTVVARYCVRAVRAFSPTCPYGHSYGEWIFRTEATNTSEGERYRTCSVCEHEETEIIPIVYSIGDIGPAGGWIIYDCDADNTELDSDGKDNLISSTCGWRYLEAAPTIMYLSYPDSASYYSPQIGGSVTNYNKFSFGEWTQYSTESMTGLSSSIGTGKENTDRITSYLSGKSIRGYTYDSNGSLSSKTSIGTNYAAMLCERIQYHYDGKVYSDWFLPSFKELEAINKTIFVKEENSYPIGDYMSSSECTEHDEGISYGCYIFYFTHDPDFEYESDDYKGCRGSSYYVIPVRRFK